MTDVMKYWLTRIINPNSINIRCIEYAKRFVILIPKVKKNFNSKSFAKIPDRNKGYVTVI